MEREVVYISVEGSHQLLKIRSKFGLSIILYLLEKKKCKFKIDVVTINDIIKVLKDKKERGCTIDRIKEGFEELIQLKLILKYKTSKCSYIINPDYILLEEPK